jgi:hypothetical protein
MIRNALPAILLAAVTACQSSRPGEFLDGVSTEEFQLGGWTLGGFAGVNVDLTKVLSTFVEYKLHWADLSLELNGSDRIDTEIRTQQFLIGLNFRF